MKKHAFSLLKALSQPFLIADSVALQLLPKLDAALDKDAALVVDIEPAEVRSYALSADGAGHSSYDEAPQGSIAVLEIRGVIMKESTCWDAGTAEMKRYVDYAAQHPNIQGALFVVDSGGGAVAGTEVFANAIKSLSQDFGKPTLAFVEDLAASAAYWIASSADEIWAAGNTAQVGSIGVAATLTDNREALAKAGYKRIYVRASGSTAKNEDFIQALDGNTELIIKNALDPINAIFHQTVKANRPNLVIEEESNVPLDGSMHMASAAIDKGLIEGICTFEAATQRLFELIDNQSTHSSSQPPYSMFGSNNKFKNIAALAAKTGEQISKEMLDKANQDLATENITAVGLVTEDFVNEAKANANRVKDLQAKLDAANTLASTKDSRIAELEAEVAQVKAENKSAGATHTTTTTTKTKEDDGTKNPEEAYNSADLDFNARANRALGRS